MSVAVIACTLMSGSCAPRQAGTASCSFDRPALVASLRQLDTGVSKEVPPGELEAILRTIRRVDTRPLLGITRLGDEVLVTTGSVCGFQCGSGTDYRLRKVRGSWKIMSRGCWVS
jgi:hypothetical protein